MKGVLEGSKGVEYVLEGTGKREYGLEHERGGDLAAVTRNHALFVYYYWLDDGMAPDFTRCVHLRTDPAYDPLELFVGPDIAFPVIKAAFRLAQKALGFRYFMDLIPLDASLPVGSHGNLASETSEGAMLVSRGDDLLHGVDVVEAVWQLILKHLGFSFLYSTSYR